MNPSDLDVLRAPLAPGSLLVALPSLQDPHFYQSVVLLCSVDPEGVMGLIINRPTTLLLSEALPEDDLLSGQDIPMFEGGPVSGDHILILRKDGGQPPEFSPVTDAITLGGSMAALKDAATASGIIGQYRPFVGHAGWGMGQLEDEIEQFAWGLMPADSDWVFSSEPQRVWSQAMATLGGPFAIYATMPSDISLN